MQSPNAPYFSEKPYFFHQNPHERAPLRIQNTDLRFCTGLCIMNIVNTGKVKFIMYHILINPASRSGKGRKLWKETVEPYLMSKKIAYICYYSNTQGEVAELAKEITQNATPDNPVRLIVLGGDGTFNETLQGIEDFSSVILGYIPTGSSNDLARDLGISKDPIAAMEKALSSSNIHKMDVGLVTFPDGHSRRFATSCGFGFDAAVCEETNRSKFKAALNKLGLGKLAYLAIAVKQLLSAKGVTCEMTLDDKTITLNKLLFGAAMIHKYEGGGFLFGPNADAQDGIFNICTAANKLPKWVILLALPTAFWGKHYLFPGIDPYAAGKIHITTSAPLWIHTDGEVLRKDSELTITCMKQALQIIYF